MRLVWGDGNSFKKMLQIWSNMFGSLHLLQIWLHGHIIPVVSCAACAASPPAACPISRREENYQRLQLQLKSNVEGTLLSSKLQWATWFCLRPTSSMELKGSRANWWCIDTWHGSTSHDRRPHSWKRMADTNPSTWNWFTDWRWLALKSTDHLETLLDSFGTRHSLESPLQTLGRPCYGPVASS